MNALAENQLLKERCRKLENALLLATIDIISEISIDYLDKVAELHFDSDKRPFKEEMKRCYTKLADYYKRNAGVK